MANGPFYSGAGPRRDQTLADAEAKALGSPPSPSPSPPPAPASPPPQSPANTPTASPSFFDRIKKAVGLADGGSVDKTPGGVTTAGNGFDAYKDGGIVESCHNPANRLPTGTSHGKRGM